MPRPRVEILGAYRVDASPELQEKAMRLKFPFEFDSAKDRADAEQQVRSEISGAVLLEVLIHDRDQHFSVSDFGQDGSDQAAYSEVFLSDDGNGVVSNFDMPPHDPIRLAFYLHFTDFAKPLRTTYGPVSIPLAQAMPDRLKALIPYEPVD